MPGDQQEAALEAVAPSAPDGQGQPPSPPRATRKRLATVRADLAQRVALLPPAPAQPANPGQAIVRLLESHRATGDGLELVRAKDLAAAATPGRGDEGRLGERAWLGLAFVRLHDVTGHDLHLDAAERIADGLRRLEVPRGGFSDRQKATADEVDVAGNGAAARFLVELAWRIGARGGHRDAAEKAVRRLCVPAILDVDAAGCMPLLAAVDALLAEPLHATVVGPWEDPRVPRLHRSCLRLAHDPLVLDWSLAGPDFPDVGVPCVYLSRGSRCTSPVRDEAGLPAAAALLSQA